MARHILAALAIAVTLAAPAAATQYIVNPGFETGDFTGWTRFGAIGSSGVNAAAAQSGSFGAFFSPNQNGGIAQIFPTLPGRVYTISLWLRHTNGTATPINFASVEFGNPETAPVQIASFAAFGDFPYRRLTWSRAATSVTSELRLTFQDARTTHFLLDNVTVTAIPEPATWAKMIAGFVLTGAAMRRRNRHVVAS